MSTSSLKKISIDLLLVILLITSCKPSLSTIENQSPFPKNSAEIIVNDYSQILTEVEKTNLSKKLYDYEIATTNQIVFVSIDSITPYTDIQKYATDLGKYWGVGQKNKDNGLMLVLSTPLRKVGIATGYGTEKILTDSICQQVLDTTIIPHFKEGKYYEGISIGIDSLTSKWDRLSKDRK